MLSSSSVNTCLIILHNSWDPIRNSEREKERERERERKREIERQRDRQRDRESESEEHWSGRKERALVPPD